MKQILLFLLFTITAFSISAQCVPDELYRDSSIGVYPPPASDSNPDGGITESACINAPYEFTLTIKIPETVTVSGIEVGLDSIVIASEGAVTGLPNGIEYDCSPGDCVFTPEDTIGCLRLLGTVSVDNAVGVYALGIETTIFTSTLGSINLTFPNMVISGADGEYNLLVEEEGSMNCFVVGTEDYLSQHVRVSNTPNPFRSTTTIEIGSDVNEVLDFVVFDMVGNLIHKRKLYIQEGLNHFDFDGSALPNGIYSFSLSSELGTVSRKMVINH
jgi:hypothetical protein